MKAQTPRARRQMFAAKIDLTDVASGAQIIGNTADLSQSGCRLKQQTSLPVGSKVRVRIIYRGAVFAALGRISRVRPDGETGIAFTQVDVKDRTVLDRWLTETRTETRGPVATSRAN